jgi:hypothetical protein
MTVDTRGFFAHHAIASWAGVQPRSLPTLAIDDETGDYTRLTWFAPGADTTAFGSKSHDYPEEVFIVEGSLYDAAFDRWLEKGD